MITKRQDFPSNPVLHPEATSLRHNPGIPAWDLEARSSKRAHPRQRPIFTHDTQYVVKAPPREPYDLYYYLNSR